jgi:hypothetical protein
MDARLGLLNGETGTQLPMKTVGGSAFADLAYATTVAVGKAVALRRCDPRRHGSVW